MSYRFILFIHILSMVAWVSGLILQSLLLIAAQQKVQDSKSIQTIRAWEKWLSNPGSILVWATGLYLAVSGNWYHNHWFMLKATLAFFLGGIHGIFSVKIRKYYQDGQIPALPMAGFIAAIGIMVSVIIYLVVLKPF